MIHLKYALMSLLLLLVACKSTPEDAGRELPEPTAPKPAPWQSVTGLKTDNYSLVKFFPTAQNLIILGDNYLTELDSTHRIVREEKFSDGRITKFYEKIATNGAFFTHFGASAQLSGYSVQLVVRSIKSPQLKFEIDVTQIDTNYRFIGIGSSGMPGVLTQDNRLFLPVVYSPKALDFTNAELRFLVFKIQLIGNNLQVVREPVYYPVDLSVAGTQRAYVLSTLDLPKPTDNYFYFSAWQTYRMDVRTGRYEQVLDMFASNFVYRSDTLWAFGRRRDTPFVLGFLAPKQTDWAVFATNLGYQPNQWCSVDKHIIGVYYGSSLALFTSQLDSNKIQIRSLADNNNLPYVRDMVAFHGRVYLATNQGLVVKPLKDFVVFPK